MRILALSLSVTLLLVAQTDVALTPAQRKLAQAADAKRQYPKWSPAVAGYAAALWERGHETGDPQYLEQAQAAVSESLTMEPDNLAALKVRAQILLEQGQDEEALRVAEGLRKRGPDDLEVSSLVARAALALGRYQMAEQAAQFIRDLRPAELLGYERGAEVREAYGDIGGAFAYWRESLTRVPTDEAFHRADILIRIARLMRLTGNETGAEQNLQQALAIAPGYYRARLALSRMQTETGEAATGVETLRGGGPERSAEWRYRQAVAQSEAGQKPDWGPFIASAPQQSPRLLARFYLTAGAKPKLALAQLQKEAQTHRDSETLHLLAWALWLNQQPAEALKSMREALQPGYRDAEMLFHASQIAAAQGDREAAQQYQSELAGLNPRSPYLGQLRRPAGS